MEYAFLNDDFTPASTAGVHMSDLGLQRSYAAFDFFRLIGNKPVFLNDHLDRFFYSAERLKLNIGFNKAELKEIIKELIEKNNKPDTGIKMTITGGNSEDGINIGKPNLMISQHRFQPPTAEQVNHGVHLITHEHQRQLPDVKTTDYLMAIWLKPKLVEFKADEWLYTHNDNITESPRNNFFVVMQDDTIVTPFKNILKGITRKHVIRLATMHFKVEERVLHVDELNDAKEAFITSTTKQILPVRQIDNITFSQRSVTAELARLFTEHAENSVGEAVV